MEQSSLLSQPIELLVKQLSDPGITLKDLDNFCNSSSELRKACRTNPLFIALREDKTPAVDIEVRFIKEYEEIDRTIYTSARFNSKTTFERIVIIKFYSRIQRFILTNTLIFTNFYVSLEDVAPDYIPTSMDELKRKYKETAYGDEVYDQLEYFETKEDLGIWIEGDDTQAVFELIKKEGDPKMVKIYDPDQSNKASEFLIPLDLLKSAVSIARSISDGFIGGSATITLNGDVIYGENTGVEIVES